jgi:ABC-type transporter Mla MlaB component
MARKTKASRIGFDPLAWMKDGTAGQSSPKANEASKKAATEAPKERVHRAPPRNIPENDNAPGEAKVARAQDKPATPPSGGDPKAFALGESLTITAVKRLHGELKQLLANRKQIVLDAAAVDEVDTVGLQLLDALMREAQARQVDVRWHEPSSALSQGARALGLTAKLRLPA